ncbi:MAG: 3-oxoacyl-[acyl-carrier-protein] synthase III C-terminal domain-containing protein [Promethearchaeota archaeon]
MTTIILSSSAVMGTGSDSSIELAAEAGRICIEKTASNKQEINLLINVGIMRDQNIVEPAIAPLIQNKIKLNISPTAKRLELGKKTFSFDIINSSCGFLNAAQVIDSFFKNNYIDNPMIKGNPINKAIIVTSEVHPSGTPAPDFPFTHSAAAMLLTSTQVEECGFQTFMFNTSKNGYTGITSYCDLEENGTNSRNVATVVIDEDYKSRLEEFTLHTVQKFLSFENIDISEISIVICSQPSSSFVKNFSEKFEISKDSILNVYDKHGDTYTCALIIGYNIAMEEKRLNKKDKVLFVGGGAGLTSACALYQV